MIQFILIYFILVFVVACRVIFFVKFIFSPDRFNNTVGHPGAFGFVYSCS